jgi:predicted transcriptional regulator
MKNKKVLLTVEPTGRAIDRGFSELNRPSKKYRGVTIISFPDFETLGRVISGTRLELLSVIRKRKPSSIQELARMIKRDFKNVHQDVKLLAEFGLIELKDAGPRRSAEPQAKYSEIILAA